MLNEALRSEDSDDGHLMNIFNAIQYVHSNQILILEIIKEIFPFDKETEKTSR
jgi:hypothetical protein